MDKNLLVVDDEKYIRDFLYDVLTDEGYNVYTAQNGFDAVEIAKKHPLDLICLDIRMPGLDGAQTLEQIREFNNVIPVVIITGYGTNEALLKAKDELNARHCIFKPFQIEELLTAINENLKETKIA